MIEKERSEDNIPETNEQSESPDGQIQMPEERLLLTCGYDLSLDTYKALLVSDSKRNKVGLIVSAIFTVLLVIALITEIVMFNGAIGVAALSLMLAYALQIVIIIVLATIVLRQGRVQWQVSDRVKAFRESTGEGGTQHFEYSLYDYHIEVKMDGNEVLSSSYRLIGKNLLPPVNGVQRFWHKNDSVFLPFDLSAAEGKAMRDFLIEKQGIMEFPGAKK